MSDGDEQACKRTPQTGLPPDVVPQQLEESVDEQHLGESDG